MIHVWFRRRCLAVSIRLVCGISGPRTLTECMLRCVVAAANAGPTSPEFPDTQLGARERAWQ